MGDDMDRLIYRYWEALQNEVSSIENSPSWSGKTTRIRVLANEIHTVRMFIEAMEGNYTLLSARVKRAEESSQQMIEFTRKLR